MFVFAMGVLVRAGVGPHFLYFPEENCSGGSGQGLAAIYEVLEQGSQRWHDGKHDPWPTINFLLFILTQACKEFEQRVANLKAPRGEKTALVEPSIARQPGDFSVSDLQHDCPGVGVDLITQLPPPAKLLKG